MAKLVPLQLEDGMVIYIEAQDDTEASPILSQPTVPATGEQTRSGQKGFLPNVAPPINAAQSMQMVQNTIRTYAYYCMTAFKNFGVANIDEVTLEFGVNLSADAGIPYIASGKAQSNLKITVKCTYPKPALDGAIATNGANGAIATSGQPSVNSTI